MKQSELEVACRRLVKQSELGGVACRRLVKQSELGGWHVGDW